MANKPNNPSLWSRAKSMAKQKFDVYPSAYANGWAAKWYKSKGGTWRKAEYGMEVPMMQQGGGTDNPGFRALPEYVQAKILSNMGYGGITHPFMQDGGEPDGGMAMGQIDATLDKLMKLRQFIQPESDLEPWVSSKLTMLDHYADAVSDYMMYNPEAQGEQEEMEQMMKSGGYVVTRSNDRKGKTHKVTGPDGSVKYFGDSKLGQHPNDPERKKAFYARHKKNLENNPHFRAFARKTWEDGGQIEMMKKGGSTFSGNAWYEQGGNINNDDMYDYNPFLVMAQDGAVAPPRQDDYMDYESFAAAQDAYLQTLANATGSYSDSITLPPDRFDIGPTPPAFPGQIPNVTASSTGTRRQGRTYSGPSIVDLLASVGKASDYNSRKQLAAQLGIDNYYGSTQQNLDMIKMITKNPGVLTDYKPVRDSRSSSKPRNSSNSGGRATSGSKSAPTTSAQNMMFSPGFFDRQKKDFLAANPGMSEADYDAMITSKQAFIKPATKPMAPRTKEQEKMDQESFDRFWTNYDKQKIQKDMRSKGSLVDRTTQSAFNEAVSDFFTKEVPTTVVTNLLPFLRWGTKLYPHGLRGIPEVVNKARRADRALPYATKALPPIPKQMGGNIYSFAEMPIMPGGGPVTGDEMEVTPEQLEMLRAQGYEFEMI